MAFMTVDVLGISGSPTPDSNTDRAIRYILEAAGLTSDFVKLSDLRMEPCRACLGCKDTNQCIVPDDARELAEQFSQAKAFVLGVYTPYNSLDARTKSFMERMYCLRHKFGVNIGKYGVSVITTACLPGTGGSSPAVRTAKGQIDAWMKAEGITNLGYMTLQGNVPCLKCGNGDNCEMSGIKTLAGADATVASVGFHRFEDDLAELQRARDLGAKIRVALS